MRKIANILTVFRILAAFIIILLLGGNINAVVLTIVFVVFILAAVSDYFDGYLARKYQSVSDFGKIMDPVSDKVLIISVFGMFCYLGMFNIFFVLLIALREILITFARLYVLKRKKITIAAGPSGKLKTFIQSLVIVAVFGALFLEVLDSGFVYKNSLYYMIINICMMILVAITYISAAFYIKKLRQLITS